MSGRNRITRKERFEKTNPILILGQEARERGGFLRWRFQSCISHFSHSSQSPDQQKSDLKKRAQFFRNIVAHKDLAA
jgi:hypothetical protein